MMTFDLALTVAVFLFAVISLVIGRWIFYTYKGEEGLQVESAHLQQCPFCAYLFFDFSPDNVTVCPRCESYIAK